MKVIILCAGYATRLYPLTLDKAKALLPVAGKPLLSYTIKSLEKCENIDEIIIVSNGKFYDDFVKWKDNGNFSKSIKILNNETYTEETKLGGLGDLILAIEKENIDDDLLVILGDNLFDFDIKNIINSFNEKKETVIGVYDVKNLNEAKRFGITKVEGNKIVDFEEKPDNPSSTLASIGIYIYPRSVLKSIRNYMETNLSKDGPGNLIPYLIGLHNVYAFVLNGRWYDIGTEKTYKEVNKSWGK